MGRERSLIEQASFLQRRAYAMRTNGEQIRVMLNGRPHKLNRLDPDDVLDEAKAFKRMHMKLQHRR